MQPRFQRQDEKARHLVRAIEPVLRRKFGPAAVDAGSLSHLYLGLRQQLREASGSANPDEMALSIFIVVLSQGHAADPGLLASLRAAVIAALEETAGEWDSTLAGGGSRSVNPDPAAGSGEEKRGEDDAHPRS